MRLILSLRKRNAAGALRLLRRGHLLESGFPSTQYGPCLFRVLALLDDRRTSETGSRNWAKQALELAQRRASQRPHPNDRNPGKPPAQYLASPVADSLRTRRSKRCRR